MNEINTMTLCRYCRVNDLCTGMCVLQYDRMLSYASNSHAELTKEQKARDVAVMIAICSETTKTIEDLTNDIKEMFYK